MRRQRKGQAVWFRAFLLWAFSLKSSCKQLPIHRPFVVRPAPPPPPPPPRVSQPCCFTAGLPCDSLTYPSRRVGFQGSPGLLPSWQVWVSALWRPATWTTSRAAHLLCTSSGQNLTQAMVELAVQRQRFKKPLKDC